jgi:hypothetical protein
VKSAAQLPEEFFLIARRMLHMKNANTTAAVLPIVDSVVADGKAARVFPEIGPMAPDIWIRGKKRKGAGDGIDEALGDFGARLLSNIKPDFVEGPLRRLAQRCIGSSARAGFPQFSQSLDTALVDVSGEVLRRMLVKLQSLPALDLGVRPLESFSQTLQVYLVLFNEPMHRFLYERIRGVVVPAFELLADTLFDLGR